MKEVFLLIKCDTGKEKQVVTHLQSMVDIKEIHEINELSAKLAQLESKTKRELTAADIFFSIASKEKKELELGESNSAKQAMMNFHRLMTGQM